MTRVSEHTDVLVIGAGVNGAAVAREAAMRGLNTLLIDKTDIASGTSSASSRLVHGGPRYLEHGEFRLVRESLHERELLLWTAAHLVKPYQLLIPFYTHNRRRPWTLETGMLLYDALSRGKSTPRHRRLSRREAIAAYPGIEHRGLTGGIVYVDAYACFAERLAVEQALDVRAAGSSVLTHTAATELCPGASLIEVALRDELTGNTTTVRARSVVNASGPWVDSVLGSVQGWRGHRLIRAVKGSHLVLATYPDAPSTGIHFEAMTDGRPVLVLPQSDGTILVGSTELVDEADPGALSCSDAEIAYLLTEANRLLPSAHFTQGDVLHAFAGARPLPYAASAERPADISRDHHVVSHPTVPGLFSLTGGKLTTHRALGEMAINRVVDHLALQPRRRSRPQGPRRHAALRRASCSPTRTMPLPGARVADWHAFAAQCEHVSTMPAAVRDRLLAVYGVRALSVYDAMRDRPGLPALIRATNDVTTAEVWVAVKEEFARTLVDVVARRLMLARTADAGLGAATAVAAVCAELLGWDARQTEQELVAYRSWSARLRPNCQNASDVSHNHH
ncbi:glycerol-3-phosphate dehydrogenase/oxidase [Conexibacter sp. S30A1]|uniref:glycerol-3-phosphate dehydrogenase/oxidase n=1 Tax=Conexibacter sp. S30A1 TaxID=2937800 RepID=UPI00211369CE|nr:glycerol-3-phosphate dehydrogenase/oxidase [Conexibacter sp. S30A1]